MPKTTKSELKLIPVKHMDEILEIALGKQAVVKPPKPKKAAREDNQEE
jgi:predicted ATP-dependent protease